MGMRMNHNAITHFNYHHDFLQSFIFSFSLSFTPRLQETGYQYPATYQPQTDLDNPNPNALPNTTAQFDEAAAMGYGVLEGKKKDTKKAFVEVKEFPADAYAQATDEVSDEEVMDDGYTVDGSTPAMGREAVSKVAPEVSARLDSILDKIDARKK